MKITDFNNASYKTSEIDFNANIVVPISFNTTAKILAVYVSFKTEFSAEQEIEIYSIFGENASHKGTEVYDKCKKRFTVKPMDLFYVNTRGKREQEMYLSIGNSETLENTAYITIIYTTAE